VTGAVERADEVEEPRRADLARFLGADRVAPLAPSLAERAHEVAARAAAASAPLALRPGDRLGELAVVRPLGSGGQADVYLARDRAGAPVAVKVPRPDLAHRLLHEARLAARLDHPRIVRVLGVETSGAAPFLVLEFCPGRSLADWIAVHHDDPVISLVFVKKTAAAVLEALAYAHAQGVVHRDVKPANILLDDEGRAKVCDFGIGALALGPGEDRALAQSVAATGGAGATAFAGTPRYMAPEQENPALRAGGRIDGRADVYALGKVVYELLTGCSPATVKPVSRVRAGVPEAWDDFVFRCVEEHPEARFQTAEQAARALAKLPVATTDVRPVRRDGPENDALVEVLHPTRPPAAGIPSLDTRQAVARVREDGREPITPFKSEPAMTRAEAVERARVDERARRSGRLQARPSARTEARPLDHAHAPELPVMPGGLRLGEAPPNPSWDKTGRPPTKDEAALREQARQARRVRALSYGLLVPVAVGIMIWAGMEPLSALGKAAFPFVVMELLILASIRRARGRAR
jgi:hypothetical protein